MRVAVQADQLQAPRPELELVVAAEFLVVAAFVLEHAAQAIGHGGIADADAVFDVVEDQTSGIGR